MALIEARGLTKQFRKGDQTITPLQDVDLDVEASDFVSLMGPSGTGKTTLLNLVAGIDRPNSGSLVVAGTDVTKLSRSKLAGWRARHVGYIFQTHNLIPVLTAWENVEMPLLLLPFSRQERRKRIAVALEAVGITDRAHHYPRQLSGGQEQRVGIARAIVADPTVVVADEPTGDLDPDTSLQILDLLGQLNEQLGTTLMMVTHDMKAAARASRPTDSIADASSVWTKRCVWPRTPDGIESMKFLPYVFKTLWRHRTRTLLTVGGSAVALFVYAVISSARESLDGLASRHDRTLVVFQANKFCPATSRVPQDYAGAISEIPGVESVTPIQVYTNNCRASLDIVVFYGLPPQQLREVRDLTLISGDWSEFERHQDSALVGRAVAARRQIDVGDKFSIGELTVAVAGIFESDDPTEEQYTYSHLEFLQRRAGQNSVGTVTQLEVALAPGADPEAVGRAIDERFRSGQIPTHTRSKGAFQAASLADLFELAHLTGYLGWACLGLMATLVATTSLMAVQDRRMEHAVLQTVGFSGTAGLRPRSRRDGSARFDRRINRNRRRDGPVDAGPGSRSEPKAFRSPSNRHGSSQRSVRVSQRRSDSRPVSPPHFRQLGWKSSPP